MMRRSHPTTEWNANDDNSSQTAPDNTYDHAYGPSTIHTTYQDEDEALR